MCAPAELYRPRGHLRHVVALPKPYVPIAHVLTTSAEHEAPLGHATAAAMLGVPHTEPVGHLPATLLPGAHTVPAGHWPVATVRPSVEQNEPPGHGGGAEQPGVSHSVPAGQVILVFLMPGQ